ncbi:MAG: hypothetical protein CMK89_21820, partial [Pseudomonadales bacterium]|nr:hypothetical protein [Pseudomonadales bacterium]
TVWVNGDNGYIAMQVSGLEVLPGAGLTDSGYKLHYDRTVLTPANTLSWLTLSHIRAGQIQWRQATGPIGYKWIAWAVPSLPERGSGTILRLQAMKKRNR